MQNNEAIHSTIIIPNYNGAKYIEACLRSVATEPAYVVLVDNGSTDGSFEQALALAEQLPELSMRTIRYHKNTGFCHAVNAGIRASVTEYCIFLNNDTVMQPGCVRALERALEKDERIFSGSARLLSMKNPAFLDDGGDFYTALGWAYARGKDCPARDFAKPCSVFAACGGGAIYRRRLLLAFGGLDENHFAYLEDIDLGYRAMLYGYRNVYVPTANILHAGSASSGSRHNAFKVRLSARNSVYLAYKNMPLPQLLLNLPFLLAGAAVKCAYFTKKGLGKAWRTGFLQGIRLCVSKRGRRHKMPFVWKRIGRYCRIQMRLWMDMMTLLRTGIRQ